MEDLKKDLGTPDVPEELQLRFTGGERFAQWVVDALRRQERSLEQIRSDLNGGLENLYRRVIAEVESKQNVTQTLERSCQDKMDMKFGNVEMHLNRLEEQIANNGRKTDAVGEKTEEIGKRVTVIETRYGMIAAAIAIVISAVISLATKFINPSHAVIDYPPQPAHTDSLKPGNR